MKRRLVLGAALGATACSVLPSQNYLERRNWPMAVTRETVLPPRPGGRVLLVRSIQAGPELATRGLQVIQADGSVKSEFYEQWAVPPADGVDDDLRRWLAASGLFGAVIAPGSRLTADLVLEGELTALNADLRTRTARMALALTLIDQHPTPARVLMQRTEAEAAPLDGVDPPALARAQLAAVQAVLRQTEADVAAALRA